MKANKQTYQALDVTVILMDQEDVIRTSGSGKSELIPDWE